MTTPITTTTDDPIPRYAQLDLWMAPLGSDRSEEYEPYREHHGFADTWANLLAEVRKLAAPALTVKPRREAAHIAGGRAYSEGGGVEDVVDAVLAILPGKTTAQVRAEALRDAKARIALDFTFSGHEVAAWLDALADEEAGK